MSIRLRMLHLWLKIVNSSFWPISASRIPAYIPSILEYSLYIPPFLNCARPRACVLEVLTPDDFDVKVLEVPVVEDLKYIGAFEAFEVWMSSSSKAMSLSTTPKHGSMTHIHCRQVFLQFFGKSTAANRHLQIAWDWYQSMSLMCWSFLYAQNCKMKFAPPAIDANQQMLSISQTERIWTFICGLIGIYSISIKLDFWLKILFGQKLDFWTLSPAEVDPGE